MVDILDTKTKIQFVNLDIDDVSKFVDSKKKRASKLKQKITKLEGRDDIISKTRLKFAKSDLLFENKGIASNQKILKDLKNKRSKLKISKSKGF